MYLHVHGNPRAVAGFFTSAVDYFPPPVEEFDLVMKAFILKNESEIQHGMHTRLRSVNPMEARYG